MAHYTCPSCRKDTVSSKDKYLMGYWATRTCPGCGTRLCANPYLMFGIYFVYLWNFFWWPVIAVAKQSILYLIPLVVIWALLDLVNLRYMPLLSMKRNNPA